MEGDINDDAGACLSDGVQALHTQGLCPETMWPYSDDKVSGDQRPCGTYSPGWGLESHHEPLLLFWPPRGTLGEGVFVDSFITQP